MSNYFVRLFSTFFYSGYSPVAPGTVGTAVAACFALALFNFPILYIIVGAVITYVGFGVSDKMEKLVGKEDPGCVVIDEAAGIFISFLFLPALNWEIILSTFFLFRAFDMFKIYPAHAFEAKGGGYGIMMDDIIAGIYTNIIMQVAIRFAGLG